jgi:hypothetical protein
MSLRSSTVFQTLEPPWVRKWTRKHRDELVNDPLLSDPDRTIQHFELALEQQGHWKCSNFFCPDFVEGLLSLQSILVPREVHVGEEEGETWLEYSLPSGGDVIAASFEALELFDVLLHPWEIRRNSVETSSWLNCYRTGEYIPKHSDNEGFIQVLIGLKSPTHTEEPLLRIEGDPVSLEEGDLLVFRAHEQQHWTQPVPGPDSERLNAVLRMCD